MALYKLFALYEHATAAAARVKHPAFVWLQHFHQQLYDAGWRIELTAFLAFCKGKLAKEVFPKMYATGDSPRDIMEREGLKPMNDTGALEKIVDDVLAANHKQVEQFKGGKATVIGFLVGQVMKASRGQADPATVNQLLKSKLQ